MLEPLEPCCNSGDEDNTMLDLQLMPKSPGISKNQNLKDRVLQEVYNKKIKELKSMQHLEV